LCDLCKFFVSDAEARFFGLIKAASEARFFGPDDSVETDITAGA
jgi:hypothetical protein